MVRAELFYPEVTIPVGFTAFQNHGLVYLGNASLLEAVNKGRDQRPRTLLTMQSVLCFGNGFNKLKFQT